MKILKLVESGLVVYEEFENVYDEVDDVYVKGEYSTKLYIQANLTYKASSVEFINGGIFLDLESYTNLVFEVNNSFVPTQDGDVGGVKIQRGSKVKELYEYYTVEDYIGEVPYVKVIKVDSKFVGYGSNDGLEWFDRGGVKLPCAESISVSAFGQSLYELDSIKAYKDTRVVIDHILPDWKVEVYKAGELVTQVIAESDTVKVELPYYPFTGTMKVFDDNDVLVAEHIVEDMWGGDVYTCTANVTIYNKDDIPITHMEGKDLGKVEGGTILSKFRVQNNENIPINITLKIADYSPFGEWVHLSNDVDDAPSTYSKEIDLSIEESGNKYFWVFITRPEVINTDFNYSNNQCVFYLEVV